MTEGKLPSIAHFALGALPGNDGSAGETHELESV